MKCPSCGAAVEEGADLCLECGEPMSNPAGIANDGGSSLSTPEGRRKGEAPAAKVARGENVIRPPADVFEAKKPIARIPTPKHTPSPLTRPASAPPPPSPTIPARPSAKRKWAEEEPEPVRCPGCGVKSHAARCPNCGTRLKHDDE